MIAKVEIYKKHFHNVHQVRDAIDSNANTISFIKEKFLSMFEFTDDQFFEFREAFEDMVDLIEERAVFELCLDAEEINWETDDD